MQTFENLVTQDANLDTTSPEYMMLMSRIREMTIRNGEKGLTPAGAISHLKNNTMVKPLLNVVTVLRAFVELEEDEGFTLIEGKTVKLFDGNLVNS